MTSQTETTRRIIVSTTVLRQAMSKLAPFVEGDSVVPILENVLATVREGNMTLFASDMQNSATATVPVESTGDMQACWPIRDIVKLLATLREQPVTLRMSETEVVLEADRAEYSYKGLEHPGDFIKEPEFTPKSSFKMQIGQLRDLLRKAKDYMSNDDLRPAMTGIHWSCDPENTNPGSHQMVATDGQKLIKLNPVIISQTAAFAAIIPRKMVTKLGVILPRKGDDVRVDIGEKLARFSWGHYSMCCRLVDEKFPNYKDAMPMGESTILRLYRADLIAAVRRAGLFANQMTQQMRLGILSTRVQVHAENLDYNKFMTETLPVIEFDGEPLEIGFNAKLMLSILQSMTTPAIEMKLHNRNRACLFYAVNGKHTDPAAMHLLMPVMLNTYA